MTAEIKKAATAAGIAAFVTDSENKLDTQLRALTKQGDDAIMLVSWDINTSLTFDQHGFLDNPESDITALLLGKPEELTKAEYKDKSDEMGALFQVFIRQLYNDLVAVQLTTNAPITDISYMAVPKYGTGRHSGILAKWKMKTVVSNCES